MPRFPHFAGRTSLIAGSVFEQFRAKMESRGDDMVVLHIGDAYLPPPYELPVDSAFTRARPGFNRYCDTFGVEALREALSEKVRTDNGLAAQEENVLVTAGATNALAATFQSLVDEGDEVLFLAPYWPFARGMVRLAGGTFVEAPFYTALFEDPDADVADLLLPHIHERTVALYINSPNNPSGKVLSRAQVAEVAAIARAHDLWVVSDEAYDGMTFDGREHVSPGSLDGMFERTISIFTFSKVFMFAGLRIGYAVSSPETIRTLNKTMVHMLYSPSTIAQQMMVEPVRRRAEWNRAFIAECEETRDRVASALDLDWPTPEGAYYFFFDASPYLGGRTYAQLVDACLDAGVSVAPGGDFGADFVNWIRVCFAGEPPARVERGIERLKTVLGG